MNKLENKYNKLFVKLEKIKNYNEDSHILQDKIYRKFIKDISTNKFSTINDITKIAVLINKYVVKNDKGRWYA